MGARTPGRFCVSSPLGMAPAGVGVTDVQGFKTSTGRHRFFGATVTPAEGRTADRTGRGRSLPVALRPGLWCSGPVAVSGPVRGHCSLSVTESLVKLD